MGSRLVLGSGPLSRAVLGRAGGIGGPAVILVTDDPHTIEAYAESGAIVPGDPTDPAALRGAGEDVSGVVVAEPDPDRCASIVRLVSRVYPAVPTVVIAGDEDGTDFDAALLERLERRADRVIRPGAATGTALLGRTASDTAELAFHLRRILGVLEGPLGVVAHDNPDPDALASAVGLVRLAERHGLEAEAGYFGDVTHQQNRALINLLDLELRSMDDPTALASYGSLALVDHAKPGVNDQLPEDAPVAIVIDHHPTYEAAEAAHVDLREEVGATSTLLVEYFDHLAIPPGETVATALLFGIQTDTDDFVREASVLDFRAAERLLDIADLDLLERLEQPTVSAETLETIARAIDRATLSDGVLTSCVGRLRDRDALPQAADRLIALEETEAVLVYGFDDETIYLSARAGADGIDVGEAVRDAFGQIGSAGGHARMAGGQLPIGMLRPVEGTDVERLEEAIRAVVDDRFRDVVAGRRLDGPHRLPRAWDAW